MDTSKEMQSMVNEVLTSYEERVSEVNSLRESVMELVQETKKERDALYEKLREAMAKGKSLRRKDFDRMVSGVKRLEEEKAKELGDLVDILKMEEESKHTVLSGLLSGSEVVDSESVKQFVSKDIEGSNGGREAEINSVINDFRAEVERVNESIKGLLKRGGSLKIADFKNALKGINSSLNGSTNNSALMKNIVRERRKLEEELLLTVANLRKEQERMRKEWQGMVKSVKDSVGSLPSDRGV